jgi:hypothetical protein
LKTCVPSVEDRRAATVQCRVSRRALRADVRAVVTVGRGVNLDDAVMRAMRFPGGATDDELLSYARGLLDRVSASADAFVAAGLPPDLLKPLAGQIAAFTAARDAQALARHRRVGVDPRDARSDGAGGGRARNHRPQHARCASRSADQAAHRAADRSARHLGAGAAAGRAAG